MDLRSSLRRPVLSLAVSLSLSLQTTGCGTLLYPERRGTVSGRIDAGVAILDAVGLIFFIIPGVIAYAVDFSTGAIYLPGTSGRRHRRRADAGAVRTVHVPPQDLAPARLEAVLERETGLPHLLTNPQLQTTPVAPRTPLAEVLKQVSAA